MIIGKDTNIQPNGNKPFNLSENENAYDDMQMDPTRKRNRVMEHTDVTSKTEMNDKSFAMLQDRLNKGLISMEEFNRMCKLLGKQK